MPQEAFSSPADDFWTLASSSYGCHETLGFCVGGPLKLYYFPELAALSQGSRRGLRARRISS
jgi:hypothetical protein